MAVYTALDERLLTGWLESHAVGRLTACRGISSGIENTNFFVDTDDHGVARHFVLTIFERLGFSEVPFYLSLMLHLAEHGVPCPAPIRDRRGSLCSTLAGKPAALVTRLDGVAVLQPEPAHCAAIGRALARLHLVGVDAPIRQDNLRGYDWWFATAERVRPRLDGEQEALLDGELAAIRAAWKPAVASLPQGPIHADLFRDNALFVQDAHGPRLGGIIDFYFAGCDAWVLDLAICANDWCVYPADGRFDPQRLAAMMDAYATVRPLEESERVLWPQALRVAALRFWLSRLDDLHSPRPAELLTPHDPTQFERILRRRRDEATGASDPFILTA